MYFFPDIFANGNNFCEFLFAFRILGMVVISYNEIRGVLNDVCGVLQD